MGCTLTGETRRRYFLSVKARHSGCFGHVLMTSIATHHDETVWIRRHTREAAQMPYRMTRRVKQVEASVPKVIVRPKAAHFLAAAFLLNVNFSNSASL
jgi:hypothetical protein